MAISTKKKPEGKGKNNTSKGRFGAPPEGEALDKGNLDRPSSNEEALMQFSVPKEFKKEYKQYALDREVTAKKIFMESFEFYKKKNP